MIDGITLITAGWILLQILFRNIGLATTLMDQNMVPGFIFGRSAPGHLVIPFIRLLKFQVHPENDPPVIKQFMMNQLPNTEFCFCRTHILVYSQNVFAFYGPPSYSLTTLLLQSAFVGIFRGPFYFNIIRNLGFAIYECQF